jgi:hypothetical protein
VGLTVAQREARAKARASSDRAHDRYVQRTYGLEPGQYDRMLEAQDSRCAICGNRPRTRRLAVDHDHDTGLPRALLCTRCNKALGQFEFTEIAAWNAAHYLLAIAEAHERTRSDQPRPLLN